MRTTPAELELTSKAPGQLRAAAANMRIGNPDWAMELALTANALEDLLADHAEIIAWYSEDGHDALKVIERCHTAEAEVVRLRSAIEKAKHILFCSGGSQIESQRAEDVLSEALVLSEARSDGSGTATNQPESFTGMLAEANTRHIHSGRKRVKK
jgi:hypothetical protein